MIVFTGLYFVLTVLIFILAAYYSEPEHAR